MLRTTTVAAFAFALAALPLTSALSQSLPVPSQGAARDVPSAKELPDPRLEYKILYDLAAKPEKPTDVNPGLVRLARFVNTLAKSGVPANRRHIAVIIHGGAAPAILTDAAHTARHGGPNPNLPLMRELKAAGVEFHVCGQGVLGAKLQPTDIDPTVQVDLWAMTTTANFLARGYSRMGGG
jgi:intracellular sulfur oxidation DsrE/DsrF family protein